MIDLHCHSIFSDGKNSPEILLQKAKAANIEILSITDHDNIEAYTYLKEKGIDIPLTLIPGIELSTTWKKVDIHVLGLNIDLENSKLQELISKQKQYRINRAQAIALQLEKLCKIKNVYEKARAIASHDQVGRPHLAQVLINENVITDMGLAFKRFLARGKSAYVQSQWSSFSDVVTTIKAANGDAILAHPLKYKLTASKLSALIAHFKELGGDGIEVISGDCKQEEAQPLVRLCKEFDLLASIGSDYHSDFDSNVSLGKQCSLPLSCVPIWSRWKI